MGFESRLDSILEGQEEHPLIEEGTILNINKMVSDAIKVPEGDYIVALVTSDSCKLVPKESGNQTFEVFKRTLEGFYNPAIHKKQVTGADGPSIIESQD